MLDEEAQRWYCYKDDQVYYAKDKKWVEPQPRNGVSSSARPFLGELGVGAKAGALSGLIFAMISITLEFQRILISVKLAAGADVDIVSGLLLFSAIFLSIFFAIGGTIGLVFVKIRNKLPGKSITMKAFVFALVIWIIVALVELFRGGFLSPGSGLFGIGRSAFIAFLFGYLFNWFAKKEISK